MANDDDKPSASDAKVIASEKAKARDDLARAKELWAELCPLILRERDIEVLAWIAGEAPQVVGVRHLLTQSIVKARPAFREAQGGGGRTTNDRKRLENWE